MKIIRKTDKFVVIDDLVSESVRSEIWAVMAKERFHTHRTSLEWSRTWSYEGMPPYSTEAFLFSDLAANSYLRVLGGLFVEMGNSFLDLIGDPVSHKMRLHAQMFGAKTKINWHFDSHSLGSFTWYVHPVWSSYWGGELFIPDIPKEDQIPPHTIDHIWEDNYLSEGIGYYITPKPNRCILTGPNVYHSTNRVDVSAGDHMRCAVVGFILKE